MPSPVGPNQPNRAFGTTPPAEQQPEPDGVGEEEMERDDPGSVCAVSIEVEREPSVPRTQDPPAPAGGSNTTDTDRQSPTEDIAAATADPTGEHDGPGISGSNSRNV